MREKPRFQFSLAMVFVVVLAASLLALLVRHGNTGLATFLGGSALGSVAARRFTRALLGGAVGGAAALWLLLLILTLTPGETGTVNILKEVPGVFLLTSAAVIVGGLAGGAVVGAAVWYIRFLKENPPPEDDENRR